MPNPGKRDAAEGAGWGCEGRLEVNNYSSTPGILIIDSTSIISLNILPHKIIPSNIEVNQVRQLQERISMNTLKILTRSVNSKSVSR
jgi:hypothetical protein